MKSFPKEEMDEKVLIGDGTPKRSCEQFKSLLGLAGCADTELPG